MTPKPKRRARAGAEKTPTTTPKKTTTRRVTEKASAANAYKFNEAVRTRLLAFLRAGNFRNVAAKAAGIYPRRFRKVLAHGKANPNTDAGRFYAAVLKAEAEAEAEALGNITSAGKEDWRASAWLLQHGRSKHRYAAPNKLEHSGPSGGPIETRNLEALSDEELDQLERIAAKVTGGGEDTALGDDTEGEG